MKSKLLFLLSYFYFFFSMFHPTIEAKSTSSFGPGDDEAQIDFRIENQLKNATDYVEVSFNLEYLDDEFYDHLSYMEVDVKFNDNSDYVGLIYLRHTNLNTSENPYSDYDIIDNNDFSFVNDSYKIMFNNLRNGNAISPSPGATYEVRRETDTNGVIEHRIYIKLPIYEMYRTHTKEKMKLRVRGSLYDRVSGEGREHAIDEVFSDEIEISEEVNASGKDHLNYSVEEFSNQGYNRVKLRLEKFSNEINYDHLACLEIGKRVYDSNGNRVFEKIFAKLNHTSASLGCEDISNPEQTITFNGSQGDSYKFTSDAAIELAQSGNEYWTTDGNGDILAYVDDYFTDSHKEFEIEYYVSGSYWVRNTGGRNEKRNIIWNQNLSPQISIADNYTIPNISLTSAQVSNSTDCALDLSWTNSSTYGDASRNYVYIYKNNEFIDKVQVNSGINSYQDIDVEAGETYNYQLVNVYERNRGGHFYGQKSTSKSADIDLLEAPSGLASQQSGCDGNIDLTWSFTNNPSRFILQRKTTNTNFQTVDDNINGALRAFTDTNVVENEVYYYRIAAVAGADKCGAIGEYSPALLHSKDQVDITGVFDNSSYDVEASKGYFDNRTELEWSPNFDTEQYIHQYKIYTRELGSTITPKLLETLDINSKTYRDVNGNSGTIYEYFVVAERVVETVCGRQITASYPIDALNNIATPTNLPSGVAYDIGLRVASGVINGNISFEGGTAVKDVKVVVERQNDVKGKSIYFNGSNSYANIEHNNTLVPTDELTVSAWIKPENLDKFSVILEKQVSYGFHVSTDGSIYFYIKDQANLEHEARTEPGVIVAGQWQNITGVFNKHTRVISIHVNGEKKAEKTLPSSVTSMSSGNQSFPLTLGRQHGSLDHYFQGYIDEVKLYHKALSDVDVTKESGRYSATDSNQLKLYLKVFEGSGNQLYDVAHEGDLYFKNDATLFNTFFSDDIPTQTQLGNAGYTDDFGNYNVFAVEYANTGENFNIIPTATIGGAVHEFNPSRKTVFVGEGNKVNNNQDFIDVSSFSFSGYVRFDFEDEIGSGSKTSGSQGVQILLDGTDNVFGDNGAIFETDEDGFFDIDIPIGDHYITFIKNHHTFENGRFPETGTHNFQENITGIEISDNTTLILSGKVAGGLDEGNKKLFMSSNPSVNNIGQAKFTLTSEDGIVVREVITDVNTGEYTINLPPKKYTSTSVQYTKNNSSIINSGDIDALDLTENNSYFLTHEIDTTFVNSVISSIDTTSYHLRKDFIYRTPAELLVTAEDGNIDMKTTGEDSFSFKQDNETYFQIDVTSLDYPVYIPRDSIPYRYKLKAIENYTNIDNNATSTSSVPGGEVQVFNGLGYTVQQDAEGKLQFSDPINDKVLLDNNGEFLYEFVVREANTSINTSSGQEHLSFTKQIGFSLNIDDQITSWPNPSDSNERQYAYVFGSKVLEDQNSFVTVAPETVDFVLRDPPGSNSYAYLESGQEFTTTQEIGHGSFQNTSGSLSLGVSIYWGNPIVGFTTNFEAFATAGVNATRELSSGKSLTSTVSFNEIIETNSDPNQVGRSDIFVAKSENLETVFVFTISPLPVNLCSSSNCFGSVMTDNEGNNYKLARVLQASTKPTGSPTYIVYSQNHIENVLIPDLIELRNSEFTKLGSRYVSKISITDPNFGTNNDDAIWGSAKTSSTPIKTEKDLDFDGPSYRFTPIDVKEEDNIRKFNQQIRLWKEALAKNEVDKWMAKNYRNENKENISISGGSKIEKSESSSVSNVSYMSFERTTSGVLETELLISGFPGGPPPPAPSYFSLSSSNEWGDKRSSNFSEENTTSRTVGYVLHDENEDDFISVDVFEGTGNDGPIFITKGGQTMCPYQDKTIVKYATPSYVGSLTSIVDSDIKNLRERINDLKIIEGEVLSEIKDRINESLKAKKKIYEDEIVYLEEYKNRLITLSSQINNGEVVLDAATVQRDKPQMLINGAKKAEAFNVPADEAANFNLSLINDSQSGDAQFYAIKAMDETNPNGLEMTIDGQSINTAREFLVQGSGGIQKVLKVRRGPNHYDYENIGVVITSTCQADPTSNDAVLSDTIYFNTKYLPICTDVNINSPSDNWTVNNSFNNKLPISIGDYDVNISGFEEIKIQYKPSTSSDWTLLTTYYRNDEIRTTNGGSVTDPLLPTSGNSFTYDWELGLLPDGAYDIRAVSKCALAENETEIYSGTIDRTNPTAFGAPQPSDGVLSSGEEISIQFNESINENLLSPANFDIRGVLNGGAIRHSESVAFGANANDYVEVKQIEFTNQAFSVDFYAKRNTNNSNQILLSQGNDEDTEFLVGFNTSNQIYFTLGGISVIGSNAIDNNWHHYAITYNPLTKDALIYVDAISEAIDNSFEIETSALSESLLIGKSNRISGNYFDGNMHELRIWSKELSVGEVSIYATKRLIGNEAGLMHNWKMEEANGVLALDHVRSKHAIMNATWAVSPQGYALELAGTQNQASISSVAFSNEADFTIEFWFKSNGSNQVLLSNGKGDLTDVNTSGWTIGLNSSGKVYAVTNGQTLLSTNAVNNDDWTHIAIVSRAKANTTLFVNAEEQSFVNTSLLEGFGGSKLSIGQRVWYTGTIESSDKYFTGHIDELRFWNSAINTDQLDRDRYNMLSGDEVGLFRYYSFDDYTESFGILSATSSLNNQVVDANVNETMVLNGTALLNQDTPTIRLERPVENVNFSYVVNNDKIIITLNAEPAAIENVTLDFTVNNIKDLNGNNIPSPIKWSAYVDKNQVIWQDHSFDLTTDYEKELVFESQIVNNSGESKTFDISNVPFWLMVSPSSGTIGPLTTTPVTFTVSSDVNVGDYAEDILLSTSDFGYAEKLNVGVTVKKALPEDWVINPNDYEFSMNVIGQIEIENVISRDQNNILGVFVDGVCRGMANLTYLDAYDNYQAFLTIYSNSSFGDDLEFRIWEHEKGIVHSSLGHNLSSNTFTADTYEGTAVLPKLFSSANVISSSIDVVAGWKWISFNLSGTNLTSTNVALSSLNPTNGDIIKTRINEDDGAGGYNQTSLFDTYNGSNDVWFGDLSNTGPLKAGVLYKIKLSEANKIKYEGSILNPLNEQIPITTGWNYIGYIGLANIPINEALSNYNASPGDLIKSQYFSAIYDPSFGWIGTLKVLTPNEGYMMRSASTQTFVFPSFNSTSKSTSKIDASFYKNKTALTSWKIDANDFENNMTIVAVLDGELNKEEGVLGAFVNGECKGVTAPVYSNFLQKNVYLLNVGTEVNDSEITFKYKDSNQNIHKVIETSNYSLNAQEGDLETPKQLTIRADDFDNVMMVYPNPVKSNLYISLPLDTSSTVQINLIDAYGKIIYRAVHKNMAQGIQNFTIDTHNLSVGIYSLSIVTDQETMNEKIIISK